MKDKFVSVKDRLPDREDYYLVLAPNYCGKCHIHGGIACSKFNPNYKQPWAIERGKKTSANWKGDWEIIGWMEMPEEEVE